MSKAARFSVAIAVVALVLASATAALAAPSANLEQVRNGTADATVTPTPTWGTGNAGASNSHYLESHSIAYRTVMNDLPTDGTVIELVLGYDVKRSGSYALDHLTHYQRVLPHVLFGHSQPEAFDPLAGVSGVAPLVTTTPMPLPTVNLVVDPDGAGPEPAMAQPATNAAALTAAERAMTLFGGTLVDVTWVSEADVALATSSSESRVRVRFTATSPTAVLAWGGHIACRWDWGFNPDGTPRSAGGISGSSYHMRLVNWNLGNLGNQDRSMSTDAVYPVPQCGISNLGPFCAGTTHSHTAPSGMETYHWTLFDNTAGAVIVGSDSGTTVTVSTSTAGSYGLLLTTGASGFTKQCQATVMVNAATVANAGADLAACVTSPQLQLAGSVVGGTGSWTGGNGTFTPGRTALDAVYTPTAAEIAAGGVTLTLNVASSGPCPGTSDALRLSYLPAVNTNAGTDIVVCTATPLVQLSGAVSGGATTGVWSGGAGTFTPDASTLNATYLPTAAEIAAGGVTLTLTSADPDGPCAATADAVQITIQPVATVDAGLDAAVCATSPQVQLAGVIGGAATGATWTGGNGTFAPGRGALDAVYTPSAAEIAGGGVTLTLLTNDPAGPCAAVSDAMLVTILPAAIADAGADIVVCSTSPLVQLAGSVSGAATGGTWVGGSGTFVPGRTAPNAAYTPSADEIAAGSVTLTLVTNDPAGPCEAVSDAVAITIAPAALVNAGPDQIVCASDADVVLQGSVGGGASGGTWTGGAGAFSPNASTLNATYLPTAAEIAAGTVTLTLITNDPAGPCAAVSDAMRITIDPVTVVNAGPDVVVCSTSPQAQLHGTVTGTVTTGSWVGGTGTFSPGRNALNAVYTPSASEIQMGNVLLVLVSSPSSRPCPQTRDMVTVWINRAVTVSAGPDQMVCLASPTAKLAGSIGNGATGATWTGGTGTFNPGPTALTPLYTPSAAEIAAGKVTLTLTTNDPAGPCPAVSDAMTLTINAPTVSVPSRVVCSGVTAVKMCADAKNGVAPYTYLWSTGATTPCITVADTGSYTVTITDSKGCQASGSGVFRWRDCQGMLAHTVTTCSSFQDGTGEELPSSDLSWSVRDGVITQIAPGVFFYFTKVTAPASEFTIQIVQAKDNPVFPFCPVAGPEQMALYNSDCTRIGSGTETSPGQVALPVTGAAPGQVFIVGVKYSLKALVGTPMPDSTGCHYDFSTVINGLVVDRDPDGLTIGTPRNDVATATTTGGGGGTEVPRPRDGMGTANLEPAIDKLELYRPAPNPFSDGMRMAYAVGETGHDVSIRVYDVAGRMVRSLASGFLPAGRHSVTWDGRDEHGERCRKGVYFVHARIGPQVRQVRVTFLR